MSGMQDRPLDPDEMFSVQSDDEYRDDEFDEEYSDEDVAIEDEFEDEEEEEWAEEFGEYESDGRRRRRQEWE
ncbi:MAG: hypothetical protein AMS21_04255 [Gemmatimonas sp. SG8_38_2]|nr:MAG: hypothetical protein AMS21_04255 [Gemmatimonas sp. SG8_38_2]